MMDFLLWRQRSTALHALSAALNAGASPSEALTWLASGHPRSRWSIAGRRAHDLVAKGEPLSRALTEGTPALVEAEDMFLLKAGEQSGNVPEVLLSIADGYERNARELSSLLGRTAYPVLLFHAVALVTGLIARLQGGSMIAGLLKILVPGYFVAAALVWLYLKSNSRRDVAALLLRVPLVGAVLNRVSLLRYLRTLRLAYDAGVPLPKAAATATEVVKNLAIAERLATATEVAERGEPLTPALAQLDLLRPEVARTLCIGEQSGQLSATLAKAEQIYTEDAQRLRARFIVTLGSALYFFAAGLVAYRVISFYANYLSMLR
ncbi:MAG TPA: type II secretion system F family protein [Steroidobacteraceae bacterium]|nr:type II secretion system F family protein [Steroidobacteraceae bacterium]